MESTINQKYETRRVPFSMPCGRKTVLLVTVRLSIMTSTRPLPDSCERVGKSRSTMKSLPTCASTKVCLAIASRRITLEEYGVRFPDMNSDDSVIRANEYGRAKGILIDFDNPLGIGQEGMVWKTNRETAIKVFDRIGT